MVSLREYPSRSSAIFTSILGLAVIALGFAVYRRSRLAAWILVGFSLLDVLSRILKGHNGYLMPGVLFVFALNAAIALRRPIQVSTLFAQDAAADEDLSQQQKDRERYQQIID